eukprot:TRINITY_DN2651_c0_g1_i4.p1 TRINITY_DN2651_c0_g1~~TRINITY_DN2651_c0_g1_i4.p1  ORF type:complete len:600 (+),score=153.92 TRINITY_DN2651_c0_g1_i4:265-2064(+)
MQLPPLVADPLQAIDLAFAESAAKPGFNPRQDYAEALRQQLQQSPELLQQVPLLNTISPQEIPARALVRYRGMVQDMLNPEFFLGAFQERMADGQSPRWRSGLYRDSVQAVDCGEMSEERIDQDSVVMMERQQLYCVPIPGETIWIQQRNYPHQSGHRTAECSPVRKRGLDLVQEEELHPENHQEMNQEDVVAMETDGPAPSDKRTKPDAIPSDTTQNSRAELHFPVDDQPGCACLIKVYDSDPGLKICDVVEFFGILSFESEQAAFPNPENDPMMEEEALGAPPPSLVPRLHCVLLEKLAPSSELLSGIPPQLPQIDIAAARATCLAALASSLGGDQLAAEYALLQLLSSVHGRTPGFVLGKFSLNLACKGFDWSPLGRLLHQLLPRMVQIPLSIEGLNKAPFSPVKNYNTNRLKSGILQLSDATQLVLDESVLNPGRLDSIGLLNVKALGLVLAQQQVEYDFQYYRTTLNVDLPTLVTSEGKSMLPVDCMVSVVPSANQAGGSQVLEPGIAEGLRAYLAHCRQLEYSVPETVSKSVETEFVNERQKNANVTAETLNYWLQTARLVSLSFGSSQLTPELWVHMRTLESQRESRIKTGC